MSILLTKLTKKLSTINEEFADTASTADTSWKDPHNANYDRQWAEDALYHTVGPLTDSPKWYSSWSSGSEPVPGFQPGGPAPKWTPEEVVFAMAGDPQLAFKAGARDNPRSPAYGRQGGSPLWRTARRVARVYKRDQDPSFVLDMYSNGFVPLVRMMQPGFDEGRSSFIQYTIAAIKGAMQNGIGGTQENIRAQGGDSTSGVSGLTSLLKATTPEEATKIADQVQGKYQTTKSHDKDPGNPFGSFSPKVRNVALQMAQALSSGNEESVDKVKNHINQLIDEIDDAQIFIPGASTGMGQAISTPDRKTSIGVSSMDLSTDDKGGSMAGNLAGKTAVDAAIDPEAVYFMLDIALAHDLTKWLEKDPELGMAAGIEPGERLGRLTANELRCVIRNLGPLGADYPGKGKTRAALNVPRDGKGWWKPLEDPEIEPIPNGDGIWHSIWSREGNQEMGPTEIAREFTKETQEFEKLGIKTVREIKIKAKTQEVISKVAISKTTASALMKLKLIGHVHRGSFGLDESRKMTLRNSGFPLLEDYDPVDRRIIAETWDRVIAKITKKLMEDMTPEPVVKNKGLAVNWGTYHKSNKSRTSR